MPPSQTGRPRTCQVSRGRALPWGPGSGLQVWIRSQGGAGSPSEQVQGDEAGKKTARLNIAAELPGTRYSKCPIINARSTWCLLRKLSPPCTAHGGEGGAGHFPAADGSETSPARVDWGLVGRAVGSLVSVCMDRRRRACLQPLGWPGRGWPRSGWLRVFHGPCHGCREARRGPLCRWGRPQVSRPPRSPPCVHRPPNSPLAGPDHSAW